MLKNIPIRLQKHILNDLHVVIVGEPRRYPGEGPADPSSPFSWDQLRPNWGPKGRKKIVFETEPPPPPPPLIWSSESATDIWASFSRPSPWTKRDEQRKEKSWLTGLSNGKYNKINFCMYWHVPKSVDTIHLQNQLWTRRKSSFFIVVTENSSPFLGELINHRL